MLTPSKTRLAGNLLRQMLLVLFTGALLIGNCAAVIRIEQPEAKKCALAKPNPELSLIARQLRLRGKIELEVTISVDGSVETVKPLTGNPLLVECAMSAVRKWKFTPFLDHGSATQAITRLTFEFTQ